VAPSIEAATSSGEYAAAVDALREWRPLASAARAQRKREYLCHRADAWNRLACLLTELIYLINVCAKTLEFNVHAYLKQHNVNPTELRQLKSERQRWQEKPSLLFLLGFRCHFLRVSAAIGGNASGALGHALCEAIGYLLSRESRRDPIVREMTARRGSMTLRLP
jgi:hypothetical protein